MSLRRSVLGVLGVLLLLVPVWVLYVGWLAIDEAGLPPVSALPAVPADAERLAIEKDCGSGGCWRELRLRPPPGTEPEQLVAALGLRREACRRDNWPDPRATCTTATVVRDVVVVSAQYRW